MILPVLTAMIAILVLLLMVVSLLHFIDVDPCLLARKESLSYSTSIESTRTLPVSVDEDVLVKIWSSMTDHWPRDHGRSQA